MIDKINILCNTAMDHGQSHITIAHIEHLIDLSTARPPVLVFMIYASLA